MSRPSTITPSTSSAGRSSFAKASIQVITFMPASDGIDDGVGDHFVVVDALPRRELQAFGRAHDDVDVAADVEHRGRVRELGAEHRVVGLALEAPAAGLA